MNSLQTQQKLQEHTLQQLQEQLQLNIMQQTQLMQQQAAVAASSSIKKQDTKQLHNQVNTMYILSIFCQYYILQTGTV